MTKAIKEQVGFWAAMRRKLKAGVPILTILEEARDRATNPSFAAALGTVAKGVGSRCGMAETMARHADVFSRMTCRLVLIGEQGGMLEETIGQIVKGLSSGAYSVAKDRKPSPRREIAHFWRGCGWLMDAGVPLDEVLEILGKETAHSPLREAIRKVRKSVQGGKSFADALAAFPRLFPDKVRRVVAVAERKTELQKVGLCIAAAMGRG
ncbi:MAG: type II secretion system F family protein [Planctomycetota bacterium]|nr:type II secretion system F family protein [Planctomycetota bacterium]